MWTVDEPLTPHLLPPPLTSPSPLPLLLPRPTVDASLYNVPQKRWRNAVAGLSWANTLLFLILLAMALMSVSGGVDGSGSELKGPDIGCGSSLFS
jgi:hypothetical protein